MEDWRNGTEKWIWMIWRNDNCYALLVGMQNGAIAMESGMIVS